MGTTATTGTAEDNKHTMDVTLTGWGNLNPARSKLVTTDIAGATDIVPTLDVNGAAIRGNGRSYGDQAQNSGGTTLKLVDGKTITITGTTATCSGDVTIGELTSAAAGHGLFVPVIPGTEHASIGGAIANDVHGKNHHRDGSIGTHTRSIELLDATGELRTLTPEQTPEEFWATIGGIGMTGLITRAEIQLIDEPVRSMKVTTSKHASLPDLLDAMKTTTQWRYSVAWLDLAGGRSAGRGILWLAEHDQNTLKKDRTVGRNRRTTRIPDGPNLINPATTKVFNTLWWAATRPGTRTSELEAYFHPLDRITNWNAAHGQRGFHQYQFVIPFDAENELLRIVKLLIERGHCSPLVVLKRLGAANPAPLSFPMPGWTLAVDMPAGPGVKDLARQLDGIVVGAGGRHYLAKDSLAGPETIRRGYPKLEEWLHTRATMDPNGRWVNDQARRLGLL